MFTYTVNKLSNRRLIHIRRIRPHKYQRIHLDVHVHSKLVKYTNHVQFIRYIYVLSYDSSSTAQHLLTCVYAIHKEGRMKKKETYEIFFRRFRYKKDGLDRNSCGFKSFAVKVLIYFRKTIFFPTLPVVCRVCAQFD